MFWKVKRSFRLGANKTKKNKLPSIVFETFVVKPYGDTDEELADEIVMFDQT